MTRRNQDGYSSGSGLLSLGALLLRFSLALSTPAVVLAALEMIFTDWLLICCEVAHVGLISRWIIRDPKHDLVAFPQAGQGEVLRGGVDELLTSEALIRAVDQYHLVVYVETLVRTGVPGVNGRRCEAQQLLRDRWCPGFRDHRDRSPRSCSPAFLRARELLCQVETRTRPEVCREPDGARGS
mgnify:CR=1 FL=1